MVVETVVQEAVLVLTYNAHTQTNKRIRVNLRVPTFLGNSRLDLISSDALKIDKIDNKLWTTPDTTFWIHAYPLPGCLGPFASLFPSVHCYTRNQMSTSTPECRIFYAREYFVCIVVEFQ